VNDPALATTFCQIPLSSPVVLAAGTAGTLDEMGDVLDLSRIGAVTTKSITLKPREGHETWRIIDAGPAGMLNAVGLANVGLDAFLEHYAPRAAAMPCKVFASVSGFSIDEFVACCGNLDEWAHKGLPAIELNVSCPNVHTGVEFGHSPPLIAEFLRAVRPVVKSAKLVVKFSPLTPDLPAVARAAITHGADALTIANTVRAMAIDVHTRKPRLSHGTGGLSGPGIHPLAVRLVHEVYTKVAAETRTPIIGLGGVMRWEHAAEFILAGASAIGMGTALFADPRSPLGVNKGLAKWTRQQGAANLSELVGTLRA
jgi:dihydroorotate dehydrogenase (NAD+) catalytic subunit